MKEIMFSIAIPAFKKRYLAEAIDSVLHQSYSNFELVVVDDCSPENLVEVVGQFDDSRVHYHRNQTNCGAINVVDNWNICLNYCNGDYVICMGDDDRLLPHCLEEYSKLIRMFPEYHVYHGWTEIIDEQSNIVSVQEPRPLQESVYSMIWNRWKGRKQYIGDFLYERKALIAGGGFFYLPVAWGSDDVSSYIAAKEKGIINSQIPIFQYRQSTLTITNSGYYKEKCDAIISEQGWMHSFLTDKPTDRIDLVYYNMITMFIDNHYEKKLLNTMKYDIRQNSFKQFWFWLWNCADYSIGRKKLFKSLCLSFCNFLFNK